MNFRSDFGRTDNTQYAIARSSRLPLQVPVRLTGMDASTPVSEDCHTTVVNAHGCGVIAKRAIPRGVRLRLEILAARRYTTAVVSEIVSLGGSPETWLIGLELETPGNFWGIDYAPSDWKIEVVQAPTSAGPQQTSAPESPGRNWRLTDISTRACYLITLNPFDEKTRVVLSVRTTNAECVIDGVVRTTHSQSGMGVEFTDADQRPQIAALIECLMETREVPRVFVGRKEGHEKQERLQGEQRPDDDVPDPLLELIREGPALSLEQFLSHLRAQRLGTRRDPRVDVVVPVWLTGTDAQGKPLNQQVTTMNISRRGAHLRGMHGRLRPRDEVVLERGTRREVFQVTWVGAENSRVGGQIGVSTGGRDSNFWDEILQAATATQDRSGTPI